MGTDGDPKHPGTSLGSSTAPAMPGFHNQHLMLWEQILGVKSPPDTHSDGIPRGWGGSGTWHLDFP